MPFPALEEEFHHMITIFSYIDDWLLLLNSYSKAKCNAVFTLSTLVDLMLQVNLLKSKLEPSQCVNYIGTCLDYHAARVFIPNERILKLYKAICPFHPFTSVIAH